MNYEEFNEFCGALRATNHVIQWGGSHVWKVGGKVFAIGGWEKSNQPSFTFKTSSQDYHFLCDQPGYRPAPYFASRGMKWIQQFGGQEMDDDDLRYFITESYRLVFHGLTKVRQKELGLEAH